MYTFTIPALFNYKCFFTDFICTKFFAKSVNPVFTGKPE